MDDYTTRNAVLTRTLELVVERIERCAPFLKAFADKAADTAHEKLEGRALQSSEIERMAWAISSAFLQTALFEKNISKGLMRDRGRSVAIEALNGR